MCITAANLLIGLIHTVHIQHVYNTVTCRAAASQQKNIRYPHRQRNKKCTTWSQFSNKTLVHPGAFPLPGSWQRCQLKCWSHWMAVVCTSLYPAMLLSCVALCTRMHQNKVQWHWWFKSSTIMGQPCSRCYVFCCPSLLLSHRLGHLPLQTWTTLL